MIEEISKTVNEPTPAARLAGQRLLITGAAAGLGLAIAKRAAAEEATVILLDKDLKGLEKAFDAIVEAGGPEPALYPLDLLGAQPHDYQQLAERIEESIGGLDQLINNAAELGQTAPLALQDPQRWLQTLQTNINGPFLLTQSCLGLLKKSQGHVVFISDGCGREGKAAMGAYAVSKFATEGLMATLAAEASPSSPITTYSIDPGPMRTALRRQAYAGEMASEIPEPDSVAATIIMLLDPGYTVKNGARVKII